MTTPATLGQDTTHPHQRELAEVMALVAKEAAAYLDGVDERLVRSPHIAAAESRLVGDLPETGIGAAATMRQLIDEGIDAAIHSTGPRFFHFVMGGVTPAALGADWITTALDQIGYAWVASPLAVRLEELSLRWLRDLFGLPAEGGGVLTTGATMANFVSLAAARQWWGEQHGVDIAERGLAGLPPTPIFSSGYIHPSAVKAFSMLGLGRDTVRRFERDAVGRLDIDALRAALVALDGQPAILVGNAGEVNGGDFDPIDTLADLAAEHGAWLHVDGAFGLFARVSPRTRALAAGVERADSVVSDGHKWLNVPYDCGFAFLREPARLPKVFAYSGAYLAAEDDDAQPNFGVRGPESSRRARSLVVWSTLRAYGREGYRSMVERHLDLAVRLGLGVDESPVLERLADVQLNIVCFRLAPDGWSPEQLNALNERLGKALLEDGRFYVGTTTYDGRVALRPAFVNWRTRETHVDEFLDVVHAVGARLVERGPAAT